MATFEESIYFSLENLCAECPVRDKCKEVTLARTVLGGNPEEATQLALIEAHAASDIVFTSVFRQAYGCEKPIFVDEDDHNAECEGCGKNASCPAFTEALRLTVEADKE